MFSTVSLGNLRNIRKIGGTEQQFVQEYILNSKSSSYGISGDNIVDKYLRIRFKNSNKKGLFVGNFQTPI